MDFATADPGAPRPAAGLRAFVILWAGQVVSLLGTALTRFALMVWSWDVTGEATTLALQGFFNIGTTVLLSPLAGVVVDRMDRRTVLIWSNLGSGLVTLAILPLYLSGELAIWHVYVAATLTGACETFQFPAYSAAITLMVPRQHYARASGMISLADSASRIFGPPIAGVLLPWTGFVPILLINVGTFLAASLTLLLVDVPEPPPEARGGGASFFAEAAFGFRYIYERPGLFGIQLISALGNLFAAFAVTLRAPMILARTGGDETLLGNVLAAVGVGGTLGALLLIAWGGPRRHVMGFLVSWVLAGLGNLFLGLGRGAWVWAAGSFIYPFFITVANGANQAIWQVQVAPALQGRVFSARRLIAQLSALPTLLLAGPLADHVFEPAMAADGALVGTFAPLVGTGPGAGMSLLLVITAVLTMALTLAGATRRAVREVEHERPAHSTDAR